MKAQWVIVVALAVAVCAGVASWVGFAEAQYSTLIYREQGGNEMTFESGSTLDFDDGADLALGNGNATWNNGVMALDDATTGESYLAVGPGCQLYDDFTGIALDTTNDWALQSVNSGTAAINAAIGGTVRITTGAADDDDVELAGEKVWRPNKGPTAEFRLALNDVSHTAVAFGLADLKYSASNDEIAVVYNTQAVFTSSAQDGLFWFHDPDAATDYYRCVAIKAGTGGTVVSSTTAPANGTNHVFGIRVSTAGTVTWLLDGATVGTSTTAVTTTSSLAPYVGVINHGESAANTVDVDYVRCWQGR